MVQEGGSSDSAAAAQHTKWVLEAIGKIKYQKQRPNEERIRNILISRYHVTAKDVAEYLKTAVDSGAILQVLNKGVVTYKDPKRVTKLVSRRIEITPDADLSKIIVRSLREIGDPQGTSVKQLESYIRNSFSMKLKEGANLSNMMKMHIKRGVNNGVLKMEGSNVRLTEPPSQKADVRNSHKKTVNMNVKVEDVTINSNEIILPFERHKVGF